MDLSVVPYLGSRGESETKPNGRARLADPGRAGTKIRYRECLRNHAASIGGHANDGCGEFMPGGEEGSDVATKCAACGCHRNFHRKEVSGECGDQNHPPMLVYNAGPRWDFNQKKLGFPPLLPPPPLPHPTAQMGFQTVDLRMNRRSETPERGDVGPGTSSRKRFRTKFTQEQKEKMMAFAEKMGWKIQKHDDVALQEFCMEVGVKRHVLKVWMHNNKNTLGKKEDGATITV